MKKAPDWEARRWKEAALAATAITPDTEDAGEWMKNRAECFLHSLSTRLILRQQARVQAGLFRFGIGFTD